MAKSAGMSPYAQPKVLPKGRKVSQTTKAPKLKGMAGFTKFGRVGGRVVPGNRQP